MKLGQLVDVARVLMGTAPPGESYNQNQSGYPLIAGAADFGEEYPRPKKFTSKPTTLSAAGDIIICIRATIGDLNWSDGIYCLGRGVAGIRVRKNVADRKYIFFCLKKQAGHLKQLGTGSTFHQIRRDNIENCPIPIPPLPIQKKIATILEKADQVRRKRQEAFRLTDQFLQSAFMEMFGNPVGNPKGWEVKNIEDVCHKVTDGTHDTPKYVDTGIPLVTSKNLLPGGLDFSSALNISPADHKTIIKRSHPEKDDILFAMIGTIGNATIISTDMSFSIKNVALFKPDKKKIMSSYLLMVLRSPSLMKKLIRNSKGGTQKFVALGPLRAIDLPIPPSPEQQRFAALVQKIEELRKKQHQGEKELETLFQSLMQKAFRGDLINE